MAPASGPKGIYISHATIICEETTTSGAILHLHHPINGDNLVRHEPCIWRQRIETRFLRGDIETLVSAIDVLPLEAFIIQHG
jgi:hypothetical protein